MGDDTGFMDDTEVVPDDADAAPVEVKEETFEEVFSKLNLKTKNDVTNLAKMCAKKLLKTNSIKSLEFTKEILRELAPLFTSSDYKDVASLANVKRNEKQAAE